MPTRVRMRTFSRSNETERDIDLSVGDRVLVSPTNPQKLKHRDRTGVIVSFEDVYMPSDATIRFDDNNRCGKVEIRDLVPTSEIRKKPK